MSEPVRSSICLKTTPVGLRTLLRSDEIQRRVRKLAEEIERDCHCETLLVIGTLKGAFVFLADLIRSLELPVEIDFVRLASYGSSTTSSQNIRLIFDLTTPVADRDLLVVDDIVDTGLSLAFLVNLLLKRGARSVRTCVLLDKPYRRLTDINVDYVGFTVPDVFVVGYGIDLAEQHRQYPDIYAIGSSESVESSESSETNSSPVIPS